MDHLPHSPISEPTFCGPPSRKRIRAESTSAGSAGSVVSTQTEPAPLVSGPLVSGLAHSNTHTNYPKKRVSVACEVCRSRKTRCDARRPACSFCAQIGAQCVYRTVEQNEGDKSKITTRESNTGEADSEVLTRLHRIEGLLYQIHNRQSDPVGQAVLSPSTLARSTAEARSPPLNRVRSAHRVGLLSFEGISRLDGHECPRALVPMGRVGSDDIETEFFQGESLFSGPPDNISDLCLSPRRCWQLQQIFYRDVLPWCPIIDQQVCSEIVTRTVDSNFDPKSIDTSLTLFILALGSFAEDQQHLVDDAALFPGRDYFRVACKLVDCNRQFHNTVQYVQCYILMAFYLLYGIRPLQAFEAIRRASEKIVLLLQPRSSMAMDPAYRELCSRSYWACYLIEHELQAYVSYSTNLLQDFEDTMPLPMSDYEEPGIYWFLSEIALRRIFARQRGGRGWNEHTLYEPVVVGEIALQMAQWHSNLPTPVKFDPEGPHALLDSLDVRPLLDPMKVFLRAQFYAVHAALYWQYVVQLLSIPTSDVLSRHAGRPLGEDHARIIESAALSLRYSVVHVFAVESLLQGRHLLLVPNLVGLLCNAYFLICSFQEPGLEAIQHPKAKEAISVAIRCIKTWEANPVVAKYTENVENLMKLKNIGF